MKTLNSIKYIKQISKANLLGGGGIQLTYSLIFISESWIGDYKLPNNLWETELQCHNSHCLLGKQGNGIYFDNTKTSLKHDVITKVDKKLRDKGLKI